MALLGSIVASRRASGAAAAALLLRHHLRPPQGPRRQPSWSASRILFEFFYGWGGGGGSLGPLARGVRQTAIAAPFLQWFRDGRAFIFFASGESDRGSLSVSQWKRGALESTAISVFNVSRVVFFFVSVTIQISMSYTVDHYVLSCHNFCSPRCDFLGPFWPQ